MDIRAVAFDVNGTLVRIMTDEGMEQIFRSAAHFLTYQGIDLHRHAASSTGTRRTSRGPCRPES
jgi:phosphoglycolate phosphatase-like HAD superfamily hydrolase